MIGTQGCTHHRYGCYQAWYTGLYPVATAATKPGTHTTTVATKPGTHGCYQAYDYLVPCVYGWYQAYGC